MKIKTTFRGMLDGLIAAAPLMLPTAALARLDEPDLPVEGGGLTLEILGEIIQKIAQFLLTVGVVAAVGFIIWGGIRWMMAGADTKKVDEAKLRIKSGIYGVAIVLGVGLILSTISKIVTGEFFGGF